MPARLTRLASKQFRIFLNQTSFHNFNFVPQQMINLNRSNFNFKQSEQTLQKFYLNNKKYNKHNFSGHKPLTLISMTGAFWEYDNDYNNMSRRELLLHNAHTLDEINTKLNNNSLNNKLDEHEQNEIGTVGPIGKFFVVLYVCVLLSFIYLWLPNPYNHTFAACVWLSFLCSLI